MTLKVFRTNSVPANPQPNSIYFVAPSGLPNFVEVYVVGNTSSSIRRVPTQNDIISLIQQQLSNISEIKIVQNISERNALNPTTAVFALVLDASDDPTVNSGAASYVYNPATQQWIKIAEYESMDVTLTWESIVGRPSSTPAQIDDAVAKRHVHANLTQLNKIGEDSNGFLTYNNQYPKIAWDATDW